jgi:hypothetical protein
MAELYAEVRPGLDQLTPPPRPDHPLPRVRPDSEPRRIQLQRDLPGLGSLQDRHDLQLLVDRVDVGVHALRPVIADVGLAVSPDADWLALAYHRGTPEGDYELARSVLQFHDDLLVALTAADHQAGLAYGLGRAVADLSLRINHDGKKDDAKKNAKQKQHPHHQPNPASQAAAAAVPVPEPEPEPEPEPTGHTLAMPAPADQAAAAEAAAAALAAKQQKALTDDLRDGRVKAITGWLEELRTALPPHAAGAVIGSINQWQRWAAEPVWGGAKLNWHLHGKDVVTALTQQGKRWRLLLTGLVDPLDALIPDDYVQAAGFFVGRVRQILQQLVLQYWRWIGVGILAMIGAVVGSLTLLSSPAAKDIGVAVSVFGWLGLTGRSLSGALTRTVGHVEHSLWQAELDLAAAWANTTLPNGDAYRQLDEAGSPRLSWPRFGSTAPKTAGPGVGSGTSAAQRQGKGDHWLHRIRGRAQNPAGG